MFEGFSYTLHRDVIPQLVDRALPTDSDWEAALVLARGRIEASPMFHNGMIRFARWSGNVHELEVGNGEYAGVIASQEGASPQDAPIASLGALVMLRCPDSQWIFARRAAAIQYGGVIGTSAAGQIDAGESWQQGALREANEELGIGADDMGPLQPLGTIVHEYRGAMGIDTIWSATINDPNRLQITDEVSEIIYGDAAVLEGEQLLPTLAAIIPWLESC